MRPTDKDLTRPTRARILRALLTTVLAACGPGISLDPQLDASKSVGGVARDDASMSEADPNGDASGPDDVTDRPDQSVGPDRSIDGTPDASADRARDVATVSDVTGDIPTDRVDESTAVSDVTTRPDVSRDAAGDMGDAPQPPSDTPLDETGMRGDADVGDGCGVGCETDCYVDASVQVDGDGSKEAPFKTISACIEVHKRSPGRARTAHVSAGTYDESLGEHFPLVLRGLSLEGAGQDQTIIRGSGYLDHAGEGGTMNSAYMTTVVAGDRILPTHLSGFTVRPVPLVPTQGYLGVFCDQGNATGEVASPAGQTFLDALKVGPGFDTAVLAVTSTNPTVTGCNMVMTRSTVTGAWMGLDANGCNGAVPSAPVLLELGNSDPTSGNRFSWVQAQQTRGGSITVGNALTVDACAVLTSLQYNTFSDSGTGAVIGAGNPLPNDPRPPLVIKHNVFERLSLAGGLTVYSSLLFIEEISDNRFSAVNGLPLGQPAAALALGTPYVGKLRRNVFEGNDVGVWLYGGSTYDFGRPDDPGGNVFRCNSRGGGHGSDVLYAGSMPLLRAAAVDGGDNDGGNLDSGNLDGDTDGGAPPTLHFAGNAWDHTPPRLGDFTADDGIEFRSDSTSPLPLDVSSATLDNTPCPAGKTP